MKPQLCFFLKKPSLVKLNFSHILQNYSRMTVFIEVKKYLAFLITCSKAVELTLKLTSPTLHRNNQDTDTRRAYVF